MSVLLAAVAYCAWHDHGTWTAPPVRTRQQPGTALGVQACALAPAGRRICHACRRSLGCLTLCPLPCRSSSTLSAAPLPCADLVPREVAESWLKYFREELPCVAFKSSTQKQVWERAGHMAGIPGGACRSWNSSACSRHI